MSNDTYPSTNMHNIEVLVFSNHAFSLEVLMRDEDAPSHFVTVALTTHEVIMAIAIWENCFGFMVRPQIPKTHASFQKYAPGSWTGTVQGSKQNILRLLHATGFDIIRFSVAEQSKDSQFLQESFFDYSIRVPLSRIAVRIDVFLKELKAASQETHCISGKITQTRGEQFDTKMLVNTNHSDNYGQDSENNGTRFHRHNELTPQNTLPLLPSTAPRSRDTSKSCLQGTYFNNESQLIPAQTPLKYVSDPIHSNKPSLNDNSIQVTETIRLPKCEVSAIIGPQGKRIRMIGNSTHCRLSVMPSTLETMNSRFRNSDFPHIISLTGKPQQVTQAKIMLRRALLEHRSK